MSDADAASGRGRTPALRDRLPGARALPARRGDRREGGLGARPWRAWTVWSALRLARKSARVDVGIGPAVEPQVREAPARPRVAGLGWTCTLARRWRACSTGRAARCGAARRRRLPRRRTAGGGLRPVGGELRARPAREARARLGGARVERAASPRRPADARAGREGSAAAAEPRWGEHGENRGAAGGRRPRQLRSAGSSPFGADRVGSVVPLGAPPGRSRASPLPCGRGRRGRGC